MAMVVVVHGALMEVLIMEEVMVVVAVAHVMLATAMRERVAVVAATTVAVVVPDRPTARAAVEVVAR